MVGDLLAIHHTNPHCGLSLPLHYSLINLSIAAPSPCCILFTVYARYPSDRCMRKPCRLLKWCFHSRDARLSSSVKPVMTRMTQEPNRNVTTRNAFYTACRLQEDYKSMLSRALTEGVCAECKCNVLCCAVHSNAGIDSAHTCDIRQLHVPAVGRRYRLGLCTLLHTTTASHRYHQGHQKQGPTL